MDLSKLKHKATFTTVAHLIAPTDQDRFVAKASLQNLKGILPAGVNPEDNPDLFYFAANGARVAVKNLNDDAISVATAVEINETARHKFISQDHDREKVNGFVLHPALTKLGSNDPLTAEEALASGEPFNMAIVGVLWKTVNPNLTNYLQRMGDSTDDEALSLSWEVAFEKASIAVGSTNLFESKVIAEEDPLYGAYEQCLRANGGTGKDPAGNLVYRVLSGAAVILGYSIVAKPAGNVKGILPLEKTVAEEPVTESTPAVAESELQIAASVQPERDAQEKNITSEERSVTPLTTQSMKISNIEQLATSWADIRKLESSADVVDFVKSIEDGAKNYVGQIEAEKERNRVLTEAAAQHAKIVSDTEARAAALEQSIADLKNQLEVVRQAAASAEAQSKFTERMASFDEKFDLDDEDRTLIAEDVRAIESDEAFEAYAKKQDKLLCAKKKGAKKEEKSEKPAPFEKKEEKSEEGSDCDDGEMKAAVASIKETPGQKTIPNGAEPVKTDLTLKERMFAAMANAVKNNGKTVQQANA